MRRTLGWFCGSGYFSAQHKRTLYTPAFLSCAVSREVTQDHAVQLNKLEDLVLDETSCCMTSAA